MKGMVWEEDCGTQLWLSEVEKGEERVRTQEVIRARERDGLGEGRA